MQLLATVHEMFLRQRRRGSTTLLARGAARIPAAWGGPVILVGSMGHVRHVRDALVEEHASALIVPIDGRDPWHAFAGRELGPIAVDFTALDAMYQDAQRAIAAREAALDVALERVAALRREVARMDGELAAALRRVAELEPLLCPDNAPALGGQIAG